MRYFLLGLFILASSPALAIPARAENPEREVNGKKLSRWITDLRNADPGVREAAISAISQFGKEGRKAGRALVTELADNDVSLRVNAIIAIGVVGLEGEELTDGVKALGRLLINDQQHIVRFQCAITLGRLGTDARHAIPQLCSAAKDLYNSWETRKAAAQALRAVALDRQEGPDPRVVQALLSAARDVSLKVRLEALLSLIVLGGPAKSEAHLAEKLSLEKLTRDPNKTVALWARVALMRIDKVSEPHLIAIGHLLESSEPFLRIDAANALGLIGPEAKSQVPNLAKALRDKDEAVVAAAISSLALIGDEARPAIPALQKVREERNEGLRVLAKEAIDRITTTVVRPDKPAAKKP